MATKFSDIAKPAKGMLLKLRIVLLWAREKEVSLDPPMMAIRPTRIFRWMAVVETDRPKIPIFWILLPGILYLWIILSRVSPIFEQTC